MSKSYDIVIIGGGHNGLVCAAYLAKAGRKVLVLEAEMQTGGLGATREFAPGFRGSVAHTLPQLSKQLVRELDLEGHGFSLAADNLDTVAMGTGNDPIHIGSGGLRGASSEDSASYLAYSQLMHKFAKAINPFWHKRPPMVGSGGMKDAATLGQFGWNLRTLGKTDMRELMRMIALPAQDLMDEYFESPVLKAALSWDANVGSKLAPRSPNNAVLALLYRMSGDLSGGLPLPREGTGGFTNALAAAAQSLGAEVRTGSPVARVTVEQGRVTGVELASGELIAANNVISNADPKTSFFKLLGARHLDVQFTHRINRLRTDGYVAKLHLALKRLPRFTGLDKPDGRLILAPSMGFIENAFDEAKYGGYARELPMEVLIPSLHDDSLAPPGQHVLSAQVQYAPYAVKGGWDTHRETFLENTMASLERYAPDIRDCLVASELLTPADLEQQFHVTGGHWHHAEFALDNWWMNRPTYGASQYRTPVPGFYLCGAGAHPGGGIMGAAGRNAAHAILEGELIMPLKAQLRNADDIDHVHNGILPSPFHSRTSQLNINQQWGGWNGYASATYYADAHLEYFATRNTCAVFDVSPMRKYRFTGADCPAMLDRMVTRDVIAQAVDTVAYNVWCTDNGKIVDDGTLFRLGPEEFMVCCADPCYDWFKLCAVGFETVEISDISDDIASLALQGPTSCALLKALGFKGIEQCKPFQMMRFPFANGELMISRTGYTGDLGYELWLDPRDAEALWDALFDTGALYGIQPLGDESLDMARLEAGFLAPDVDFHGSLHTVERGHDQTPLELGLGWILNFKKTHFNGRSALLELKESGNYRRLLKLDIEGNKAAENSILYADKHCRKEIGFVTSAMWSPVVKANIAYASVEAKYFKGPIWAEIYHQKELRWQRKVARCTRVTKPFWSPERAKATPPPDC